MNNLIKFRLFKQPKGSYYYDPPWMSLCTLGWEELTSKEYQKLAEKVRDANSYPKAKWKYILVIVSDSHDIDLTEDAESYLKKLENEEKRDKARALREKKQKEKARLERKKKQLEKLKKELGE
jgi:hypothetical protein